MAAGVTLEPDKLEPFRARLNELARAKLQGEQLRPTLRLDAEVTIQELTWELMKELEKLEHQ
jgi:single-stranded-DNA-specific exonuclease